MADPPARSKVAPKTTKRSLAKATAGSETAPPPGAAPAATVDEPEEIRYVGELRVVKDEPLLSPLGRVNGKQVTFSSYRIWTLEDGNKVHACAKCYDFTGSRGEVRKHLVAEHDMKNGGARKGEATTATAAVTSFMALSMAEVVELVQSSGQWGEMLDAAETQLAEWKDRALTAESENRRFRSTFDRLGFVPKETD